LSHFTFARPLLRQLLLLLRPLLLDALHLRIERLHRLDRFKHLRLQQRLHLRAPALQHLLQRLQLFLVLPVRLCQARVCVLPVLP